jgi:molybdopterin molybdotransferase
MWYIELNTRDVLLFRPRSITIKSRHMSKAPLQQSLITPTGAQQAIDSHWPPAPIEERPLDQCLWQILRQDVYAERDNPPFDRVCMDGIAVSSSALARGQRRFAVEAMQPAGAPPLNLENADNAIEVMTGAMLPGGTDCIIPMEQYEFARGIATLTGEIKSKAYTNVQRRGEDSMPGVPMLTAGIRLGAPEIAIAASAGLPTVAVSRQPDFMVVSTGDELIEPGSPIAAHQVRRSNAYAIVAALRSHGFDRIHNDHIADNEATLTERLQQHLAQRDVLILSGGVSKGKFDLVPKVLKKLGVREVYYRVAQRPGMPMWFGIGPTGQVVFGLPGNPVATLVCLRRYVIPGAVAAMGARATRPEHIELAAPFGPGRTITQFVPVVNTDGKATPRPTNGPGDFLGLTGTAGFVELPPQSGDYPAGFEAALFRW